MTTYFVRRLLLMIPTFLGVTMIAFAITRVVPGGPLEREIMQLRLGGVTSGESGSGASSVFDPTADMSSEALEQLKKNFDLDKPGYVAYFLWLKTIESAPAWHRF
jgi:microcin C transport system permease protein